MSSVEILIATWSKDVPYLFFNLRSIAKFASGFAGTTLLVAEQETPLFDPIASEFHCAIATYSRVPDAQRWHLQMQSEKCKAHLHCPEADFVCHVDSDCIFTEPVTPEDYFVNGKPVMLIEEFRRLPGNPWREVTEKALGKSCEFETMRRHPQVNYRELYVDLSTWMRFVHMQSLEDYFLAQKPTFPWGVSEHCLLGAFALYSDQWNRRYHWIDCGKQTLPADKLMQFWSHSPIDQPQDLPSGGRGCPIETYRRLGLL